mmetsp:Transcript_46198/g.142456  ORF Transcript_46198/g.142456 Transcript_46198/m.142456 type:complete len:208 (-) Transcript_46198:583-1206(-)
MLTATSTFQPAASSAFFAATGAKSGRMSRRDCILLCCSAESPSTGCAPPEPSLLPTLAAAASLRSSTVTDSARPPPGCLRMWSGSACSGRNSKLWLSQRRTLALRSMHMRWRRSWSRPMRKSMLSCSSTVIDMGRKRRLSPSPRHTCAMCTRPMMREEPTPVATPAKRLSMRRVRLHSSATRADMTVICAPESTKAEMGRPLTDDLT